MTHAAPTRVLVVDDNAVVRAVLREMLDNGRDNGRALVIVGEATTGADAVHLATSQRPDVTLLDHRLPLRDGIAVVAALAGYTRVLMLTRSGEDEVALAAIRAGAAGYLVHGQFSPTELASAIHAVAQGAAHPCPPPGTGRGGLSTQQEQFGLTRREREIMELIAQGWTNKAIAQHLFLAPKTVQNHINRLFAKLGTRTRAAAITAWRS